MVKSNPSIPRSGSDVILSLQKLSLQDDPAAQRSTIKPRDPFLDPVTWDAMEDPVMCNDGATYERHIAQQMKLSPISREPMEILVPNHELRAAIAQGQPPVWDAMLDPVMCSDGYTRDRSTAEALKLSPITHQPLKILGPNVEVRGDIFEAHPALAKDYRTLVTERALAAAAATDAAIVTRTETYVRFTKGVYTIGSSLASVLRYDDLPRQRVTLDNDIEIQATLVTIGQWSALMGNKPASYYDKLEGPHGLHHPMTNVNRADASAYLNEKSSRSGLRPRYDLRVMSGTPGKGYHCPQGNIPEDDKANGERLPWEKEWEIAARSGQYEKAERGIPSDTVWCSENSGKLRYQRNQPVGLLQPNKKGMYDMVGNVWEMTNNYVQPKGGTFSQIVGLWGPTKENSQIPVYQVARGGDYSCKPSNMSLSMRDRFPFFVTGCSGLGFRAARPLID